MPGPLPLPLPLPCQSLSLAAPRPIVPSAVPSRIRWTISRCGHQSRAEYHESPLPCLIDASRGDKRCPSFAVTLPGSSFSSIWSSVLTAALGFANAACLWQLYFARIDDEAISRAAASGRWQAIALGTAYVQSHLVIYAGITAASVGVAVAIAAADHALASAGRAALCGGLAAALLGIAISQSATMPPLPTPSRAARLLANAVIVVLGLAGGAIASPLLTALLAAVLAALLGWESR